MKSELVYLSLGGNLGDVYARLQLAYSMLEAKKEAVSQLRISHYYLTAPQYYESPHPFINAVCSFWTSLPPEKVFEMTQSIEKQLGKVNKAKNADRPIDIDILFYGHHTFHIDDLEIPHPRWKERLFVLVPLADLTEEILLGEGNHIERYLIKNLIQPLKKNIELAISRLERGLQKSDENKR